jgi:hypothetical protein
MNDKYNRRSRKREIEDEEDHHRIESNLLSIVVRLLSNLYVELDNAYNICISIDEVREDLLHVASMPLKRQACRFL